MARGGYWITEPEVRGLDAFEQTEKAADLDIKSDKPDEERLQRHREKLENMIESMPAGSLTGGRVVVDPSDPTTWWAWETEEGEDPEIAERNRAFARDYLGIDETTASDKLTLAERRMLHKMKEDELNALTRQDFEQADRRERRFKRATESLWALYTATDPDMASDREGAAAAFNRLTSHSGLTMDAMLDLAEQSPELVVERVREEHMAGRGGYSRLMPQQAPHDPYGDENRTGGIAGGGSAPSAPPSEDEGPSIASAIGEWQKRSGFVR